MSLTTDDLDAIRERMRALHTPMPYCPDGLHDSATCDCGVNLCVTCGHYMPCPTNGDDR